MCFNNHFTSFYQYRLRLAGYNAQIIEGLSKENSKYKSGHAWVMVNQEDTDNEVFVEATKLSVLPEYFYKEFAPYQIFWGGLIPDNDEYDFWSLSCCKDWLQKGDNSANLNYVFKRQVIPIE